MSPTIVLAHGGHGDEFQGTDTTSESPESIQVDRETVQRLGIKVEPATQKRLDVGIKTTGQIETLSSQKVEVTAPIPGKVTELLVEPGASVRAGQAVAVLASSELVELRVASAEKRFIALADIKKAQADLHLAQENLKRQQKIAAAEITQAQTEVNVATEQYKRDQELVEQGAIPRRTMLESQAHLAEGKANLAQDRIFTGKIARIGSIVAGETRVVPVQAELDNSDGQLKPGLFAELEIITEQSSTAILVIPSSAVVKANGKNLVYLQNGNAFEAVEVSLGQISGDLVEVKIGLFEGDLIVTQRAPQLYAQSLRGGSQPTQHSHKTEAPEKTSLSSPFAYFKLR